MYVGMMTFLLSGSSLISPSFASHYRSYLAPKLTKLNFGGCWSFQGVVGCGVHAYHIITWTPFLAGFTQVYTRIYTIFFSFLLGGGLISMNVLVLIKF